ncbi:MAG: amidohydrolase family protein [Phycisphaerales bacterium]|nr:amidohydrolase family protein [Phycisphaerales bacterium]
MHFTHRTVLDPGARKPRLIPRAWTAALASALAAAAAVLAQPSLPFNGPRPVEPGWHAITGVTAHTAPGQTIDNATVVVRDGVIQSVQSGGSAPVGARVWDAAGMHLYAGLIDPWIVVDAGKLGDAPGRHWNPQVLAERSALNGGGLDEGGKKSLREMGFAVAQVVASDGLLRGTSAVVTLAEDADKSRPAPAVVREHAMHVLSFARGPRGQRRGDDDDESGGYPGSRMGQIALARQTLADTRWYDAAARAHAEEPAKYPRPEPNDSLVTLHEPLPLVWDVESELDAIRAAKVAKEFDRKIAIAGCGTEFRRIDAIAALGVPFIVPVTQPETPRVESIADREAVSLRDLQTWEQSPTNVRRLVDAGVDVSLTTSDLRKGEKFWDGVRNAIRKGGLSEDAALAALTTAPAQLLGVADQFGTIAPGKSASFVLVDEAPLFDKDAVIREVWIDGKRHVINEKPAHDLTGEYDASFSLGGVSGVLKVVKGPKVTLELPPLPPDADAPAPAEGEAAKEPKPRKFNARKPTQSENRLNFLLDGEPFGAEGAWSFAAVREGDALIGTAMSTDGTTFAWTATRTGDIKKDAEKKGDDEDDAKDDAKDDDEEDKDDAVSDIPQQIVYPLGAFGLAEMPAQDTVVITNATIWTCGPDGVIEHGWMIASGGTIQAIGKGAAPSVPGGARVIDAKGKHVTPGIIDCHSHTGISGGVNEGTQAVTAEVRIQDVIDPDDIDWYRELAGGTTAVNQLHGSANPIGGQNSVVKIRWGCPAPDDMRFEGAIPGIKFALGENVKQSNWGNAPRTRYPQTRMGVETIMVDRFEAAQAYDSAQRASHGKVPPRRDLELEAIAEILRGERWIHCHSYRQDEILMLCRLAQRYGFKIGTFQHILEGYKVAEAIREHAVGASSFSDWWAYKIEVYDAIPYNGAIMHDVGICVSFNSDSDELARRLNTEAAKAVKYGGVPPEEALKFVTLNPAKQHRIEQWVGSLERGKSADFVVWSGSPLSTMSRCEQTFIDGREYFSLARDKQLREQATAERGRIIGKILAEKKDKSGGDGPPGPRRGRGGFRPGEAMSHDGHNHDGIDLEAQYLWMIENGIDPTRVQCGDCGCGLANTYSSGN